jgi:NAD+ synthase
MQPNTSQFSISDLHIDAPSAIEKIEQLILDIMKKLHRDGAIVAFSGGLDSAVTVTLTVRCLGNAKVTLLYMPDRDSNPLHKMHAISYAKQLGCKILTEKISPVLWKLGTYKILPLGYIPTQYLRNIAVKYGRSNLVAIKNEDILTSRLSSEANSWISRANAYIMTKHRVRMAKIYQYAEVHNLLVVGAANRTEWLTGTFSKWGIDHCADVMPIVHLYRTQVEQLAEFLKIPDSIRFKSADPDIIPTLHNKSDLLGNFEITDRILYNIEQGKKLDELYSSNEKELVDRILKLYEYSQHMRESPYTLLKTQD